VLYDAFAPKVAIAEPPGRGVLLGIELEDRETRKPANEMCREALRQCEAKGLLVQARGSHPRTNVMRLVPPMVGTDNEIEQGLAILEEVFAGVARGRVGARDIAAE
jgi:4-aminobutyrate aminotransferase-like enzyme